MIKPVNDKIIVSVDMRQKDTMMIGDIEVKMAQLFETNFREKSPVIAKVVDGNDYIRSGYVIICHHNHYMPPSPYFLFENLYSIPTNNTIFAILKDDGKLSAVYGNVLGDRIDIDTFLPVPDNQRKKYHDRILITDPGDTKYKEGRVIITRPHAPYDIVYNFGGRVMRKTKVNSEMIVGVIR